MNKRLIYAEDAIDAVHKEFDECLVWDESGKHTADEVERVLADVPSAEVETQMSLADCISRQAAIDALNRHMDTIPVENNSITEMIRRSEVMDCREIINGLPSAQPIDVQEAYYRGKIDGIKECTTRLKKMNDEVANGRHNQQTSSQAS